MCSTLRSCTQECCKQDWAVFCLSSEGTESAAGAVLPATRAKVKVYTVASKFWLSTLSENTVH